MMREVESGDTEWDPLPGSNRTSTSSVSRVSTPTTQSQQRIPHPIPQRMEGVSYKEVVLKQNNDLIAPAFNIRFTGKFGNIMYVVYNEDRKMKMGRINSYGILVDENKYDIEFASILNTNSSIEKEWGTDFFDQSLIRALWYLTLMHQDTYDVILKIYAGDVVELVLHDKNKQYTFPVQPVVATMVPTPPIASYSYMKPFTKRPDESATRMRKSAAQTTSTIPHTVVMSPPPLRPSPPAGNMQKNMNNLKDLFRQAPKPPSTAPRPTGRTLHHAAQVAAPPAIAAKSGTPAPEPTQHMQPIAPHPPQGSRLGTSRPQNTRVPRDVRHGMMNAVAGVIRQNKQKFHQSNKNRSSPDIDRPQQALSTLPENEPLRRDVGARLPSTTTRIASQSSTTHLPPITNKRAPSTAVPYTAAVPVLGARPSSRRSQRQTGTPTSSGRDELPPSAAHTEVRSPGTMATQPVASKYRPKPPEGPKPIAVRYYGLKLSPITDKYT